MNEKVDRRLTNTRVVRRRRDSSAVQLCVKCERAHTFAARLAQTVCADTCRSHPPPTAWSRLMTRD
eukprot:2863965-Alexandrium_andersonii.AAC.1